MAINQPPITGNPVLDAWMLEVVRELNLLDSTTQGGTTSGATPLSTRTNTGGGGTTTSSGNVESWALQAFPTLDIPGSKIPEDIARNSEVAITSLATGELQLSINSSKELSLLRNIAVTDVTQTGGLTLTDGTLAFNAEIGALTETRDASNIVRAEAEGRVYTFPAIATIPDAHILIIGGMLLIEGSVSNPYDYQLSSDRTSLTLSTRTDFDEIVGLRIELIAYDLDSDRLDKFDLPVLYDGSTVIRYTGFGLSSIPEDHTLIIGGMILIEGIDYSISGTTVNLTKAIANGNGLYAVLSYLQISND